MRDAQVKQASTTFRVATEPRARTNSYSPFGSCSRDCPVRSLRLRLPPARVVTLCSESPAQGFNSSRSTARLALFLGTARAGAPHHAAGHRARVRPPARRIIDQVRARASIRTVRHAISAVARRNPALRCNQGGAAGLRVPPDTAGASTANADARSSGGPTAATTKLRARRLSLLGQRAAKSGGSCRGGCAALRCFPYAP